MPVLDGVVTPRRSKINWLEAKRLYVTDPTVSYSDIAKKYGVARTSVERHALKEKWTESRSKVYDLARDKVEEEAVAKVADRLAEVEEQGYQIMSNQLALGVTLLNAYNKLANSQSKKDIKNPKDLISPFYLNQLVDALIKTDTHRRLIVGLPTTGVLRSESRDIVATVNLEPEVWEKIANANNAANTVLSGSAE